MTIIYNWYKHERCNVMIRDILNSNPNIKLLVTDATTLYRKFSVEVEVCPIYELMEVEYDVSTTLFVLTSLRNIKIYERCRLNETTK